jgi:serine/threonine protein kinase/WD40 repeat protein
MDLVSEWRPGDVVEDLYEIREELGRGGMGVVHRVHHRAWKRDLAVKTPLLDAVANAGGRDRFLREAEQWVSLPLHPNVVPCFYARVVDDRPRLFSELLEGGTLARVIESGRLHEGAPDIALTRVVEVAIQVAWGLHHAHESDLIHQDVKPSNVLFGVNGIAKVADFGLALGRRLDRASLGPPSHVPPDSGARKRLARRPDVTLLASHESGTAAYRSPEQATASARRKAGFVPAKMTRRTDVYSWAVMMLEMLLRERVWDQGQVVGEVLKDLVEDWPEDALPTPGSLRALLERCLAEDPDRRPRDMTEVIGAAIEAHEEVTGRDYERAPPKAGDWLAAGRNNRAVSLLDLGRVDEARAELEAAFAGDPTHLETRYNLGLLSWRAGRITDMQLLEDLSISYAPGAFVARVHQERGDLAHARYILEEDGKEIQREIAVEEDKIRSCYREDRGEDHAHVISLLELARREHVDVEAEIVKTWKLPGGPFAQLRERKRRNDVELRALRSPRRRCNGIAPGVVRVAPSPRTGLAAVALTDGSVGVMDFESGAMRVVAEGVSTAMGAIEALAWADDRTILVARSGESPAQSCEVLAVDAPTGRTSLRSTFRFPVARALAITPDGTRLFAAIVDADDPRSWLFSSSGKIGRAIDGIVVALAADADGRRLALAVDDGRVEVWEVARGEPLFSVAASDVTDVTLAGERLLVAGKSRAALWATKPSPRCIRTLSGTFLHGALRGDGRSAIFVQAASVEQTIVEEELPDGPTAPWELSLSDTAEGERRLRHEQEMAVIRGALHDGRWSEAGRLLWGALHQRIPGVFDAARELSRHGRRGRLLGDYFVARHTWGEGPIDELDVAPDGATLHLASRDESVLVDRASGTVVDRGPLERRSRLLLSNGSVTASPFSQTREGSEDRFAHSRRRLTRDGRFVFVPRGPRVIGTELATGSTRFELRPSADVVDLDVSPDARVAASLHADGSLVLWDVARQSAVAELRFKGAPPKCVALSLDGMIVVTAAMGALLVCERGKKPRVHPLSAGGLGALADEQPRSEEAAFPLVATRDAGIVAIGRGKATEVWDTARGVPLTTLRAPAEVTSLALTPDGRILLVGDAAGGVTEWQLHWDVVVEDLPQWDPRADAFVRVFARATSDVAAARKVVDDELAWAGLGWVDAAMVAARFREVLREARRSP